MTERETAKSPIRTAVKALGGICVLAVTLSACGNDDSREDSPAADQGQTIARVNGQEITEHELEAELKRLGPLDAEEQPAMAREVLRRMVQRAILAQKAEEASLHRTPEVMMELRRKRAETLAKAFVDHELARQLPISKYDVEDFVDRHPHYFADRRHYVFDQVLVENDLMTEEVMDSIENLTTLEEVEAALNKMNVEFSRRLNANMGSQFPRDAVVKLDALEPGEIFLTETKDYAVISKLVESRLQPISGENALAIAKRLLITRRDAAATQKIIETLLAGAKVEFLGSFADTRIFPDDGAFDPDPDEESGAQNAGEQKADAQKAKGGTSGPAR